MKISTTITREDYAMLNKYWFKKNFSKKLIIYIALVLGLYFYLNYDSTPFNYNDVIGLVIILLFFAGLYFGIMKLIESNSKKMPADKGLILGKKKISLTEDGIIEESELAKSTIKWEAIKSVEGTKELILIFLESNVALVIPKRDFEIESDIEKFLAIINKKTNDVS